MLYSVFRWSVCVRVRVVVKCLFDGGPEKSLSLASEKGLPGTLLFHIPWILSL